MIDCEKIKTISREYGHILHNLLNEEDGQALYCDENGIELCWLDFAHRFCDEKRIYDCYLSDLVLMWPEADDIEQMIRFDMKSLKKVRSEWSL